MEDIDKNADGFIDLEEYIGKSPVSSVFKYWNTENTLNTEML